MYCDYNKSQYVSNLGNSEISERISQDLYLNY